MRTVIPYVRIIPTCDGLRYEWGETAIETPDEALATVVPDAIPAALFCAHILAKAAKVERRLGKHP